MKTIIIIAFTVISAIAYAQPRVITFGAENETDGVENPVEKNVIKISIFEILTGDFPIYYERALNDYFSAEISAGLTFGDYYGELFGDNAFSPSDQSVDARYGYSFSAALRFYPIQSLEDFYIAPEFKYRKYNWERQVEAFTEEAPYVIEADAEESRVYSMPRITMGYVYYYDYNIIFDFHVGIGMNTPTEELFDNEEFRVIETKRNTKPRIHFGFKIGYIF
ncbi:hypothetical protein [Brumimicrobium oceani]|nr:hypothetical protein [Brumimicrobium oceani]